MEKVSRLPNFIIAGVPKAGTTSLFYYLRQHPDVFLPVRKELHYFSYEYLEKNSNGPGDKVILSSLCKTRKEYESHYKGVRDERMIGEVSPSYVYYSDVSERILAELGRIKIVIILRNPIQKAYSQYMHVVRDNLETLALYDALMAEGERMRSGWSDIWLYAESSLYVRRVKKYISVFDARNVRIVIFDDLVETPQEVTRDLYEFLGVDPNFPCRTERIYNRTGVPKSRSIANFLARPNSMKDMLKKILPERLRIPMRLCLLSLNTGKKPQMDTISLRYLVEYFWDDVAELEKLLGRKLGWMEFCPYI
jgi:hypothetical protein